MINYGLYMPDPILHCMRFRSPTGPWMVEHDKRCPQVGTGPLKCPLANFPFQTDAHITSIEMMATAAIAHAFLGWIP